MFYHLHHVRHACNTYLRVQGDQLEESNTSDREGSEGSLYEYRNESEGSDSLASGVRPPLLSRNFLPLIHDL